MQRLASHFSGTARYNGTVTVRDHQVVVAVDSSLSGLALDLPAPLGKAALDNLPLRFVLNSGLTADAGGALHDDIRIQLGSGIAAHYRRRNRKAAWLSTSACRRLTPTPGSTSARPWRATMLAPAPAAPAAPPTTAPTSASTWCPTRLPRAPANC
jgi:hypothetical protein